jgi:hypothetical protein
MNRTTLGIAIVIAIAGWVAVYTLRQAPVVAARTHDPAPILRSPEKPTGTPAVAQPVSAVSHPPRADTVAVDIRRQFESAGNYWDYAHQLLPRARAGNADAQYYLSKILEFCDYANKSYFQRNGADLTLDQALQLAVERRRPVEVTQAVYDRCHEFQSADTTDLGSAAQWLALATKAGQPTAEATTAQKMYSQEYIKSFLKAGATPTAENSAPPLGDGADPRTLLLDAIKSRDPEALFSVAMAAGALEQLHPSKDGQNTNQLAWMLVACQRGYDCSGRPDWLTSGCPNCGTRTAANQAPDNRMMTIAGDNWPAVQQRAQQINAILDAGQWDELDIGS